MKTGRSARKSARWEGDSHLFNALVLDIHPYVQGQIFAETEGESLCIIASTCRR
jgi:hypothetical protein